MLFYFDWTQKDVAAITGYSHIWVKRCSTEDSLFNKLEHCVNYFEALTDCGNKNYSGPRPAIYETPIKGMKSFDLLIKAIKGIV